MKLAAVQVGVDAGDAGHEVAQDVPAARRVDDLGMELDAVQVPVRRLQAGERRASRSGRSSSKPSGSRVIESPWLIQTGWSRSRPANRVASGVGDRDVGRAVLALAGRQDVATELAGHELGAVADAEDRDAPAPDGRVGLRGAVVVDRHRAAGQDDRAGPAALQLVERRVVGQELGVDVQLADAPRDELGELAAEVEDDDRAGGAGPRRRRRRSGAGALSAVSR